MKEQNHAELIVDSIQPMTPHNKAIYEAGKSLLVEAVEVGRDYCKFMITTSLSAIPTYIALLKLILPKDYVLKSIDEVFFLVPIFLFIFSSIAFTLGYFPQKKSIRLDILENIERRRDSIINRRFTYSMIGFILFGISILLASVLLVFNMGTITTQQ